MAVGSAQPLTFAVAAMSLILCSAAVASEEVKTGDVVGITGRTLYLSRTHASLQQGAEVVLKQGEAIGRCVVDVVTSRRATCRLLDDVGAQRWSTYVVPDSATRAVPVTPMKHGRRRRALRLPRLTTTDLAFAPVPSTTSRQPGRFRPRSEVAVRIPGWHSGRSADRSFQHGRLDLRIHGAQLWVPGLHLLANVSVVGALSPANARFRGKDVARLVVRELALSYRPNGGLVSGALGRFTPWAAAGAPTIDGGQLALRLWGRALEVGTYAGLPPTSRRLFPRLDVVAAGSYWDANVRLGDLRLNQRGRVGVTAGWAGFGRVEGEVHGATRWKRWLAVDAGLRVGAAVDGRATTPGSTPSGGVDLGYLQASTEPGFGLRAAAGYRFMTAEVEDDDLGRWPRGLGAHDGWGELSWKPWDALQLSTRTGANIATDGTIRAWVGPEVSTPAGSMLPIGGAVGWLESVGDAAGRQVYLSAFGTPGFGLRVGGRAYYFDQVVGPNMYVALGGALDVQHRWGALSTWVRLGGEAPLPSWVGWPTAHALDGALRGDGGVSYSF